MKAKQTVATFLVYQLMTLTRRLHCTEDKT